MGGGGGGARGAGGRELGLSDKGEAPGRIPSWASGARRGSVRLLGKRQGAGRGEEGVCVLAEVAQRGSRAGRVGVLVKGSKGEIRPARRVSRPADGSRAAPLGLAGDFSHS